MNSWKELWRNCSPIGHNNTKHFLWPIRSQHSLDRLEMVRWESVPGGFSACAWKLSLRLFPWPDWLLLGLRGWIEADLKKQMTAIARESVVSWLVVFLYFRVIFISVLSPEKKKKKSDNRFSFFISSMFRKKWQSNKDFNFLISKKQIFIFLFSNFSMVGEKWKLKINCQYYFSFFLIKKMKIEHWFSFFIFQLSEKNEWP